MKAAVLKEIGKPLSVMDVPIKGDHEFKYGQILIHMLTAGICGAQLQEIDGIKGDRSYCPHLLGHEGCGRIVGSDQKVVVHWRKGVGPDSEPPIFGEVTKIKAGPCTTFSQFTVVSSNRITPIDEDVPNDLAALLGCCLSTALATMENVAQIKGGESVLVIGCGGVGLAMILAAKAFGAGNIVATDREFSKWKLSKAIGADRFFPAYTEFHWQDFSNNTDHRPVGGVNDQFPPPFAGYDVIIDTVGSMSRMNLLKINGTHIVMTGSNQNTEAGDFNPTRDVPRYIQMWRDGKLDGWEKIITHRIRLEQINEGIQLMRDGKAGRVMIDFT